MISPVVGQAYDCLVMFGCGMIVGAVYSVLSFARKKIAPGAILSFIQDMLFWLFAGLLACSGLYLCSYGQLSLHGFLFMALGALCWIMLFGQKFLSEFARIYDTIKRNILTDEGNSGKRENGRKQNQGRGRGNVRRRRSHRL